MRKPATLSPNNSKIQTNIPIRITRYCNNRQTFWQKKRNTTQNGPNLSNLVNIQIVNSREKILTQITNEHVPKPLSDMQRSKLRIAHLNVRSIKNRNHLIQVRELVRDSNYDILALSESWLNSTVTNAEVEIKGFKLTRLDRLGKTAWRGCLCLF